jgi:hypothetical protein
LDRIRRRPIEQAEYYDEDDDSYHYSGLEEDVGDSSEDYGELLAPSLGEFVSDTRDLLEIGTELLLGLYDGPSRNDKWQGWTR